MPSSWLFQKLDEKTRKDIEENFKGETRDQRIYALIDLYNKSKYNY